MALLRNELHNGRHRQWGLSRLNYAGELNRLTASLIMIASIAMSAICATTPIAQPMLKRLRRVGWPRRLGTQKLKRKENKENVRPINEPSTR